MRHLLYFFYFGFLLLLQSVTATRRITTTTIPLIDRDARGENCRSVRSCLFSLNIFTASTIFYNTVSRTLHVVHSTCVEENTIHIARIQRIIYAYCTNKISLAYSLVFSPSCFMMQTSFYFPKCVPTF